MANKQNEFKYLSSFIPGVAKLYKKSFKSVKTSWSGLNLLNTTDTGELSDAKNIFVSALPQLVPAYKPSAFKSGYAHPIQLFGFKDFMLLIYRDDTAIKADYIIGTSTYTGTIKASGATSADDTVERSIVQFNVYTDPDDILDGTFVKKILVFPDKLSMNYTQTANFSFSALDTVGNPLPAIEKATVHMSRLFGIDHDRVYASGFNDYTMWNLDTADETNTANAWASTTQSNIKAGGDLLGITTYDSHVIIFKHDYMQQINNNKNPFRVADITSIGTVDHRTIYEVSSVLLFCASDGVYAYTGAYPTKISDKLNILSYENAVCGAYNGEYYVHFRATKTTYIYNILKGAWGTLDIGKEILSFAEYNSHFYALTSDGYIYLVSTGTASDDWNFTTSLMLNGEIDTRRIHKLSIYADMESGSTVQCWLYKQDGTYFKAFEYEATANISKVFNVMLRMSTAYGHKVKFSGSGNVKVHYMELKYSYDGESYDG